MGRKKREIIIRQDKVSKEDFERQVREFEKQGFQVDAEWESHSSGKRHRRTTGSGCAVALMIGCFAFLLFLGALLSG